MLINTILAIKTCISQYWPHPALSDFFYFFCYFQIKIGIKSSDEKYTLLYLSFGYIYLSSTIHFALYFEIVFDLAGLDLRFKGLTKQNS